MASNVIPSDSASELDVVESLTSLEQKAIIRPNNPPPGIAGFLFDISGEEMVELASVITDHYTEANTAVQDNIALEPEKITVRGLVAELVQTAPAPQEVAPVTNPLPDNIPMTPPLTEGSTSSILSAAGIGQLAKTVATNAALGVLARKAPGVASVVKAFGPQIVAGAQGRVVTALTSAVRNLQTPEGVAALNLPGISLPASIQSAVGVVQSVLPKIAGAVVNALKSPLVPANQQLLGGAVGQQDAASGKSNSLLQVYEAKQPTPPKQTRQSSAFLYFYSLWKGRQLFSVETPWGIWTNMAILSLRSEQGADSRSVTDFTVVFKKIRIAETVSVGVGQLAGRNAFQTAASAPTQNGNVGQTPINRSAILQIYNTIFGPPP